MGPRARDARRVGDIDWTRWRARDPATLVFVTRGEEVLLIHKKRGLGQGKINGPGGKIDHGETAEQCAIRECREELGIRVRDLECCGEHLFQFTDGYSIHCFVFRTAHFDGEAVETDEAVPRWTRVDAIPFERMWEDDRLWLPRVLAGGYFRGRWIFDDERMLDHDLREATAAELAPAHRATRDRPCID